MCFILIIRTQALLTFDNVIVMGITDTEIMSITFNMFIIDNDGKGVMSGVALSSAIEVRIYRS